MALSGPDRAVRVGPPACAGRWQLLIIGTVVALALGPTLLAPFGYPWLSAFLATCLLVLSLFPTARWFCRQATELPVLPLLCVAYALHFALPVLTCDPAIDLAGGQVATLTNEQVSMALLLSIAGVAALQAGYYVVRAISNQWAVPYITLTLDRGKVYPLCLLIGIGDPILFIPVANLLGDSSTFRAILYAVHNMVLVIIGILSWMAFSPGGTFWDRACLYAIVALASVRGFATTFMEAGLMPLAVMFMFQWLWSRRLPWRPCILGVFLLIFLSPTKGDVRSYHRVGAQDERDVFSNVGFWFERSLNYWEETLTGKRRVAESASVSTSRLDLIHQLAYICSLTPSTIPHQDGSTYSYFAVTWIPRFLWPNKPEAGAANLFYAVKYGITTPEGARRSTFGVGQIGEAYINFGIPGVFVVLAIQGMVLALLHHVFGGRRSQPGSQAIFVASFAFFLNGIGTCADILFGNIIQDLVFCLGLLWWFGDKSTPLCPHYRVVSVPPANSACASGPPPRSTTAMPGDVQRAAKNRGLRIKKEE